MFTGGEGNRSGHESIVASMLVADQSVPEHAAQLRLAVPADAGQIERRIARRRCSQRPALQRAQLAERHIRPAEMARHDHAAVVVERPGAVVEQRTTPLSNQGM